MKGMSETVSTASNAADAWTNPLRDPRDLRLPRIAGPCSIVIFGVTGDLSRKKLLPAIYDLANRGPVRLSQVENEQKAILLIVRRLAETGEMVIGSGDDTYV